MALDAGSVFATLGGRFSPTGFVAFDSAMKRSAATMAAGERQIAGSQSRMSRGMGMLGKAATVGAAGGILAVGYAITKSVSKAADFEQQMSSLKATTNANARQMGVFKKAAMEAGAATKFSALDAAKAQIELAKGGLAVVDMGGALKATLALAAAGEMELADAADTTVNAMKLFGIEGSGAAHVADALATAALTTTADVSDFAKALVMGGGAAKTAGMSFDETMASLEALADSSYKNSDAGTSLKAALVQLASPTKQQKEAAESLNLELWDQNGSLKELPAMARELDSAFGGLTNKQRLAQASTIAGTDGFRVLMALYESSPAKMQAYLDGLSRQGTASAVAAEKQDNLRGKLENLSGSLETAGIAFGTGLLKPLQDGVSELTDATNKLVKSGKPEEWGEDTGNALNAVTEALPGVAAAIGDTVEQAGPILDFMGNLTKAALDSKLDKFVGELQEMQGAVRMVKGAFTLDPGDFFGGMVQGLAGSADKILSIISSVLSAVGSMSGALGKLPGVGGMFKGAASASNAAADAIDSVREKLRNVGKESKTTPIKFNVSANTAQAQAALRKIQGTKIESKVMRILASDSSAQAKIRALIALGIPPKTARVLANVAPALSGISSVQAALSALQSSKTVTLTTVQRNIISTSKSLIGGKKRAAGRGAIGAEDAVVGEGRGPEAVVDGLTGDVTIIQEPTPIRLAAEDYVIPFGDPRYRGRAIGLMMDAFGLTGYAKGKKGKAKRPIPAHQPYLRLSPEEFAEEVSRLEGVADNRKPAKKGQGPLTQAAKEARRRLPRARELSKQARRYSAQIAAQDELANIAADEMSLADKRNDQRGYERAGGKHKAALRKVRTLLLGALKIAKPGSKWARDLQGRLGTVDLGIHDADAALSAAQQQLAEAGMTMGEQAVLAQLEAGVSLAALTPDLGDDTAAAGAKLGFLSAILTAAMQAGSPRAPAIGALADQVKQAKDNLASLTTGGALNDSPDLQAQLDQARVATSAAQAEARIAAQGLSVFAGRGDIGAAPNITIQTLHPGDPLTLRAIGDAATAGQGLQPSVGASRTTLGL